MSEPPSARQPGPVALFFPTLQAGGAERAMLDVASGLHERGNEVDVVVGSREGSLILDLPEGVQVFDLGVRHLRNGLKPLAAYLRRRRPACLVATLDHAAVLSLAARRLTAPSVRVIVRLANTMSEKSVAARSPFERLTSVLARLMYPRADLIVAPSQGVADDVRKVFVSKQVDVRVIPNPVIKPEIFELASMPVPHPWFHPSAPPVILAAGRLTPQKDFAMLLDAFKLVRSAIDCRLVILGEGPLRNALETQARELAIDEYVDLPGYQDNPFAYMARASVFVLSSRYEGLPAVLIQALACGAPVVATDCPSGPSEILDSGRNGRLVPVGDAEQMAKALHSALTSPPAVPRESAWKRYSFERSIELYEAAIDEVCTL